MLWFTGLSGSGKSTIATHLERTLYERGVHTMFLDGDSLRHGLNGDLGFSPEDRAENIRRASEVAAIGFAHASVVLVQLHLALQRDRDYARSIVPEGRFFEVYTKCDLEVLKRRDPKGLYAKALTRRDQALHRCFRRRMRSRRTPKSSWRPMSIVRK